MCKQSNIIKQKKLIQNIISSIRGEYLERYNIEKIICLSL